jgi:putative glutamine amidotransferase
MPRKPLIAVSGRRWKSALIDGMPDNFADLGIDLHIGAYADAVASAGGVTMTMPCSMDALDSLSYAHALVLTGGSDVSPARYGEEPHRAVYGVDDMRDNVETALAMRALEMGLPIFAICRGMQVLNVALGGSLVQHLTQENGATDLHAAWDHDPSAPVHGVTFAAGSLGASLYAPDGGSLMVNSLHHQALARVGSGLAATGWATDGTIEAAEMPDKPVLAVQWHPELVAQPDPGFVWIVCEAAKFAGCSL